MDITRLGDQLDRTASLDAVAAPVARAAQALIPRGPAKDALHGVWLGHPLHPLLTDLPIGFWTSASVLDLIGGRSSQRAADALVGFGVLSALPTAASGAADWSELNGSDQRAGIVHAVANVTATALYALSYVARRRGRRASGVLLGVAGATAATVGGYPGGHLTFRRSVGPNRAAEAPAPSDWTPIDVDGALSDDAPTLGELDGAPLAAAGADGAAALFDRCSHLGGPLHEGTLAGGCITCPWHGSTFRLADGAVVRGPAVAPQPAYELRERGDAYDARRRAG